MSAAGEVLSLAVLAAWSLTVLLGGRLFFIWAKEGGVREPANSRIRAQLIYGHLLLGVIGLGAWVLWLFTRFQTLPWIEFVLLFTQATVGLQMYRLWQPVSDEPLAALAAETTQEVWPPERLFPRWLVGAHGAAATVTAVLVLTLAIMLKVT